VKNTIKLSYSLKQTSILTVLKQLTFKMDDVNGKVYATLSFSSP